MTATDSVGQRLKSRAQFKLFDLLLWMRGTLVGNETMFSVLRIYELRRRLEEAVRAVGFETANRLCEMADAMVEQDHRATADPIYVVQQRREYLGFQSDYCEPSDVVWIREGVLEAEEAEALELEWQQSGYMPEGHTRTGAMVVYEAVQSFFTEEGAQRFIQANRHNLKDPRVYVDSAHRNREWKAVRTLLLAMQERR